MIRRQKHILLALTVATLISNAIITEWINLQPPFKVHTEIVPPEQLTLEERIDYSAIGPVLEDIARQDNNARILNTALTTSLNRLTRPFLNKELSQVQIRRLEFLINQSLPSDKRKLLSSLFEPYLRYQRIKQEMINSQHPDESSPAYALQQHLQLIPIRESILGKETSLAFFKELDQLTEHLLNRQLSSKYSHNTLKRKAID